MADYLSRHPSPSNNNIKLRKAVELWDNWFTVNQIIVDKPVLMEQNKQPNHRRADKAERIGKKQQCVKRQRVKQTVRTNNQKHKCVNQSKRKPRRENGKFGKRDVRRRKHN